MTLCRNVKDWFFFTCFQTNHKKINRCKSFLYLLIMHIFKIFIFLRLLHLNRNRQRKAQTQSHLFAITFEIVETKVLHLQRKRNKKFLWKRLKLFFFRFSLKLFLSILVCIAIHKQKLLSKVILC